MARSRLLGLHPRGRTIARAAAEEPRKVKPISVTESVAQNLTLMITSGQVKPGEKLPTEFELMKMFDAGRSSIREAIRGLVIAGVLEPKTRRGTIVVSGVANAFADEIKSSVAIWALRDLYQVRLLLEEYAAGAAARVATPRDIAEIEKKAAAVTRKIAMGRSYFSENLSFHLKIAEAAHNTVLVYSLRNIIGAFRELREQISAIQQEMHSQDAKEHDEIVAAIKSHDDKKARQLMRAHLTYYIQKLEELPQCQTPRAAR
jgi:GntR family transcriptional repressor for pyruvate dehydrogenase complex